MAQCGGVHSENSLVTKERGQDYKWGIIGWIHKEGVGGGDNVEKWGETSL